MSALYLNDIDPQFIKSIGFMFSNDNLPQGESLPLQCFLEEAIKAKTGVSKDLTALVSSALKQRQLSEYKPFINAVEESKGSNSDDELELDLFKEDLMCIVCNGMDVGARNRLLECSDCHRLYHQECHKPIVTLQDSFDTWICQDCKDKSAKLSNIPDPLPIETPIVIPPTVTVTALVPAITVAMTTIAVTTPITITTTAIAITAATTHTTTTASTTTSIATTTTTATGTTPPSTPTISTPPVTKTLTTLSTTTTKSTSSNRHSGNSNGSHKSPKSDKYATKSSNINTQSSKSSSTSQKTPATSTSAGVSPRSNVTPNINIISADKRIQIMKKKAAKLQEKRKHLTR